MGMNPMAMYMMMSGNDKLRNLFFMQSLMGGGMGGFGMGGRGMGGPGMSGPGMGGRAGGGPPMGNMMSPLMMGAMLGSKSNQPLCLPHSASLAQSHFFHVPVCKPLLISLYCCRFLDFFFFLSLETLCF